MSGELTFSELEAERLCEALSLVHDVFLEYQAPDYSDEGAGRSPDGELLAHASGIREFMRFIEPDAIKDMLSANKMRMWTCDCGGEIVGVLAADSKHIYLLFVSGQYHRRGIARKLLDMMIEYYGPPEITVNSSPYAVEVYRRLGFADNGKEQVVNGLRFVPMKLGKSGQED